MRHDYTLWWAWSRNYETHGHRASILVLRTQKDNSVLTRTVVQGPISFFPTKHYAGTRFTFKYFDQGNMCIWYPGHINIWLKLYNTTVSSNVPTLRCTRTHMADATNTRQYAPSSQVTSFLARCESSSRMQHMSRGTMLREGCLAGSVCSPSVRHGQWAVRNRWDGFSVGLPIKQKLPITSRAVINRLIRCNGETMLD